MTSGGERFDEFDEIARLFRPLTGGAPEARGLEDDVAVLPARPGCDLVVTADALVEGVHFLSEDPPELVARKLLRVNLSDLAAKAAEPYGWVLTVSWPQAWGPDRREAFAAGIREDQARYGLTLFGGDTTATPGPMTCTATMFGWIPEGRAPSRAGARPGDLVFVTGSIGDGRLGLLGSRGELAGLEPARIEALVERYRLPQPRLGLAPALRAFASASADVSDGLVADLGHVAAASRVGAEIELLRLPLSRSAKAWVDKRADLKPTLVDLATGGDDYEIVCTVRPEHAEAFRAAADKAGVAVATIGAVTTGEGVRALFDGRPVPTPRTGWRHALG